MSETEIQINVKGMSLPYSITLMLIKTGPNELKLQISIATDKTVIDLKHAIAAKSDVEADRQRLIYSGTS